MPVSTIQKYVAAKLDLASEAEVSLKAKMLEGSRSS